MAGKPGTGGPVPKRSTQRRRTNSPKAEAAPSAARAAVTQPDPDPEWHRLASRWYVSLGKSGQSIFYEESDWAQAQVWADLLSRTLLNAKGPSAMLVTAWAAGAAELLTTEGSRRRMRIELERVKAADPGEDHAAATVTDLMSRIGG